MHYWNEEERKLKHEKFRTAPFDPRFPNTNQAKRCYVNYIDFWKCAKAKSEDDQVCQEFKFTYKEICPPFWVEKWDEERENGRHPVRDINQVEPKF